MSLPRFISLKSGVVKEYVYYVDGDADHHGALRVFGGTILSPFAKFEVQRAVSGGNRFNIRSSYNNKYWMQSSRKNVDMICCDANEPQEDTSLCTCTLFEPEFVTVQSQFFIKLIFVFNSSYVTAVNGNQNPQNFLGLNFPAVNRALFSVSDWDLLHILPRYITFKGDNEQFLSARTIEGFSYLQFNSDDIGDQTVGHEVIHLGDGTIRLKSNHFGQFWRRSPNWIWADSADTSNYNLDTVFWPIKVSSNVVALRNLGNNNFCKRLTADGKTSCLNAGVSTISKEASLEVHETVLSRDIYDVNFNFMNARVYGENVLSMANVNASNNSTMSNTVTLTFLYSETESSSFSSSVILKLGVKTKVKTRIPFMLSSERIVLPTEFEGPVEWGSTIETRKETQTTHTFTVPPKTMIKVGLFATQGKCDVPFTYTQQDTLMSGQTATTVMKNDGVYTGSNFYDFTFEVDAQSLSV